MWVLDATVLVALGRRHALDLLTVLDEIVVPPPVRDEVTEEPEATNLAHFLAEPDVRTVDPPDTAIEHARTILDDDLITGDTAVIASVIDADGTIGIVSDDRRIRTIADGLGAEVTGTIGVVVHAVRGGPLDADAAKALVRDLDRQGFHTTGSLRDTADRLIDQAADESR